MPIARRASTARRRCASASSRSSRSRARDVEESEACLPATGRRREQMRKVGTARQWYAQRVDGSADDLFETGATALLRAGVRSYISDHDRSKPGTSWKCGTGFGGFGGGREGDRARARARRLHRFRDVAKGRTSSRPEQRFPARPQPKRPAQDRGRISFSRRCASISGKFGASLVPPTRGTRW